MAAWLRAAMPSPRAPVSSSFASKACRAGAVGRAIAGLLRPALEERLGGGGVQRPREQEALSTVAVLRPEQRELVLHLDALGEGLERERLAELHERVDQRLALLVVLQSRDERSVDLQRVDGE
jgi:hypothetical protein